jgi:uncharacterized flavoprotein (TIGR03862 family)
MTSEATVPASPSPLPLLVDVAVIGAGPAGLMAAQVLSESGVSVHVFDAMPSVGRKFLLAGKGGLNLTHSEDSAQFVTRYGGRSGAVAPLLAPFDASAVRAWAQDLGIATFVGSSGRVFPQDMKAAPLLRAWLQRLRHPTAAGAQPVQFSMRHRWTGWAAGAGGTAGVLEFVTPQGLHQVTARATVLALGGASWARLGSNGAWVPLLADREVDVAALQPANCGFDVQGGWSRLFSEKFAGQPFKSVALTFTDSQSNSFSRKGEFVATATGVEGSLVYAASALLRDEIARSGSATFLLDLLPDFTADRVLAEVRHPRGSRSLTSHLKSRLHLDGIKMAMLYERLPREAMQQPEMLAAAIKAVPITLQAARPLDEAISTAGGVRFESANAALMLTQLPGVFCAGEMLDWEAPTGGYLLQACLSSGRCAGQGVQAYLSAK